MAYYIIIRGPAGSGKTAIARRMAKELGAFYVDFDKVLADHGLDKIEGDGISSENFIKGDNLIIGDARKRLDSGQPVVIDACFYRKAHINHLAKNLHYKHFIFSLKCSLKECIRRNNERGKEMTENDIHDVYRLVSRLRTGIYIDTESGTIKESIEKIKRNLSSS